MQKHLLENHSIRTLVFFVLLNSYIFWKEALFSAQYLLHLVHIRELLHSVLLFWETS